MSLRGWKVGCYRVGRDWKEGWWMGGRWKKEEGRMVKAGEGGKERFWRVEEVCWSLAEEWGELMSMEGWRQGLQDIWKKVGLQVT